MEDGDSYVKRLRLMISVRRTGYVRNTFARSIQMGSMPVRAQAYYTD